MAMVIFDVFVRYLRHRGWQVTYVRNFTDIDDKIINRAKERGIEPLDLAEEQIRFFREDSARLGLLTPDSEPRATTSITAIIQTIKKLADTGHAYASHGNVWFKTSSYPQYGSLSNQKSDELRNMDVGDGKQSARDFALWKASKPDEPIWDSPWGPGRPGWHIECSAMAGGCFEDGIDIHGGGLDLVFPHHENEIAQSECASGKTYARWWMHNGLLKLPGGRKMGKSEGNAFTIHELLEIFPAEAIRFFYLQNHYRSPLNWEVAALKKSVEVLYRLYEAIKTLSTLKGDSDAEAIAKQTGVSAQDALVTARSFKKKFYACLDDDFNTPKAIALVLELGRAANRIANQRQVVDHAGVIAAEFTNCFEIIKGALGVLNEDPDIFIDKVKSKRLSELNISIGDLNNLLARRLSARKERNWEQADAIRDRLQALGIRVLDTSHGIDWEVAFDDL